MTTWKELAEEQLRMAAHEETQGRIGTVHRTRAALYLRSEEAAQLEKQTGIPHCVDHLLPVDKFGCCAIERARRAQS